MARIKNQFLGNISGTIGPVVFKQIGKTQYIAKKPNSFIPGTDPASVFRRDQMTYVGKLSSKIYSIEIIKNLWSPIVKTHYRIYQKIWADNYHAANCNDLNIPAKLAPSENFLVTNPSFMFGKSSFSLSTDPLGSVDSINPSIEKFIMPAGVIILKDPKSQIAPPLEIISFTAPAQILDLNSNLNFNIDIPAPVDIIYSHYKFRKCHLILITLDKNNKPVSTSNCLVNSDSITNQKIKKLK
jgi:hypothetical protein